MSTAATIALYAWPVLCILLFSVLPPRRAALVGLLGGVLFLPIATIHLPGFFYSRWMAGSVGVFLGALLFDTRKVFSLRPGWIDLFLVLWCLGPIPTTVLNGLGWYEGWLQAFDQTLTYGLSYLLGRLYFHDPKGLRELAIGLFVGGLIYMPLCLIEIRMSPQLHVWVYGYHQHDFGQTMRYGGWRPVIFMSHGLEVGMWMTVSTLAGAWLWLSGSLQKIYSVPLKWLVVPLFGTTALCKSTGSLVLLVLGFAALALTRWGRTKALLIVLVALPAVYIAVRAPGLWSGQQFVEVARMASDERGESVQYRLTAEDGLARHALRQPLFGWGGWGRNRPSTFDSGQPDLATDGLWIITFGSYGMVGLAGLLGLLLLPPAILVYRLKTTLWTHPWCAPAAILAVVLILLMTDCLMNAMVNSYYVLISGALSRAVVAPVRHRAASPSDRPTTEAQLRVT